MRKRRSSAPSGLRPKKGHSFVCFAPLTCLLALLCSACSNHSLAFAGPSRVFHHQNSLSLLRFCHVPCDLSVTMSVGLSISPSVCPLVCTAVCQCIGRLVTLFVCLFVGPSVHQSIHLAFLFLVLDKNRYFGRH